MKKKEISRKVSKELNFKKEDSEKMLDFILKEILESGLSGDGFSSSILKVVIKEKPSRVQDVNGEQKTIPARRVLSVVPSEKYVAPAAS